MQRKTDALPLFHVATCFFRRKCRQLKQNDVSVRPACLQQIHTSPPLL